MNPIDLVATARKLAKGGGKKPRQADLRRAMSTAYYATFHCVARCCADSFIGTRKATRSNSAWHQVYRALQHGAARSRCEHESMIGKFPAPIQDLAHVFVEMQDTRHRADYDPGARFVRFDVRAAVDRVEDCIKRFKTAPVAHRRAFAAYVLLERRKG